MTRLIGLMLVFCAGCGIGVQRAAQLRQRARRVRLLERLVSDLATQLRYQTPTVRELIEFLRAQPMYAPFGFLMQIGETGRFCDAWRGAVEGDSALGAEEKLLLLELGGTLGTTDAEGQLCALSLTLTRFSALAADLERAAAEKGRLYRALGILGGAAAAVVLA